jgi:hypothetical protein
MSAGKNGSRSAKSVRLWPLLALNFFMADMQSGIGPFVGVFLQAQGSRRFKETIWDTAARESMLACSPQSASIPCPEISNDTV